MNSRLTITGPFGVSLVSLVLLGALMLWTLNTLATALFGNRLSAASPDAALAQLVEEHTTTMQTYKDRFVGRSAFFKPPAPPPPQPPPRRQEQPPIVTPSLPPRDPGPPPPPASYPGRPVIGIVGNEVWFKPMRPNDPPMRIAVGESKEGHEVVSINPPWWVKVRHSRGEYDVKIFNNDGIERLFNAKRKTVVTLNGLIPIEVMDDAPEGATPPPPPAPRPDADTAAAAAAEMAGERRAADSQRGAARADERRAAALEQREALAEDGIEEDPDSEQHARDEIGLQEEHEDEQLEEDVIEDDEEIVEEEAPVEEEPVGEEAEEKPAEEEEVEEDSSAEGGPVADELVGENVKDTGSDEVLD